MISGDNWVVHFGSCLDVLPTLADNSVDSVVTDPPYELGFMGKKWDSSGIAFNPDVWRECLRVLKPGGHLLAFGGSRTWHRIAVAIEDAGFEVRDSIAWLYGSGFPKSLDISKAIDKAAGAEREVIGSKMASPKGISSAEERTATAAGSYGGEAKEIDITAPATPEAQKWAGWGTALKPAFEPIVVARKPLTGTVAANVLEYGTGGLNIDGSRIGTEERTNQPAGNKANSNGVYKFSNAEVDAFNGTQETTVSGRWPANVILDEYTAELLDEQSGVSKSGKPGVRTSDGFNANAYGSGMGIKAGQDNGEYGDKGGASRFFYVAKASKRDRNEGLDQLEAHFAPTMNDGIGEKEHNLETATPKRNFHPTVKPTTLMRYLVKLVTQPGGIVLDPFTGSGSTGKAAILEGFQFIGIELTEDYLPIIEGRLVYANEQAKQAGNDQPQQEQLF